VKAVVLDVPNFKDELLYESSHSGQSSLQEDTDTILSKKEELERLKNMTMEFTKYMNSNDETESILSELPIGFK
jgi:hypothetical protein